MPWSKIASTIAISGGGGSSTTTAAINTTGADLLVAFWDYDNPGVFTISDSKGNGWTNATEYSGGSSAGRFAYSKPSSVGTGHTATATFGGSGGGATLWFAAFSFSAASPFDQVIGAAASSPGSLTPNQNNSLLIAALANSTTVCSKVSQEFNLDRAVAEPASSWGTAVGYKILAIAAAQNPAFTGQGGTFFTSMIIFKPGTETTPITAVTAWLGI